MLCRKKILEIKRGKIKPTGFIDPYVCNAYTVLNKPEQTEHNLLTAIRKQYRRREIIFPYNKE